MVLNNDQLIEYLQADLKVRKQKLTLLTFLKDPVSRFHLYMRLQERFQCDKFAKPFFFIIKFLFLRLSSRLGFSIPINTLGKGVYLPHWGTIVINEKAFVGEFSVINVGVVLGRHPTSKTEVPLIGKSVYLAPGVKVFGDVHIDDNCVIGANCVMTKSVPKGRLCLGIPGKEVSNVSEQMMKSY